MESEKLLPCPFCNGEGLGVTSVRDGYEVWCRCGAQMTAHNPNGRAKAIAAWNTRAPADLRSALEAETIERAARAMCVHDGLDPDEHIIGGQASGFEDYGPLWQAEQRSEGQLGITDYAGLARAALAPTKGDVS